MARQWLPEISITDEGVTTIAQHFVEGGQVLGSIIPTENARWKTRTGLVEAETDESTAKSWVENLWKGIPEGMTP